MARYGPFVLKVTLNSNQPTNQPTDHHGQHVLPDEAAGSRSADLLEYSECTTGQFQDNRMLLKAPEFLLPSPAPLYTNTADALGHQVTHTTRYTRYVI